MDIAGYYSDLTQNYLFYGGDANGWHHGVWETDVHTVQQSLLRSNELLVRGVEPGESSQLLDVGCGNGGLAVWAASRFGCRVTGITITGDHIGLAEKLAADRGVAHLCRFVVMDMDAMDLPAGTFDLVVNQETLCHSADRAGFLAGVHRLLRPGGHWRCIDYVCQNDPLTPAQAADREAVKAGWHIPEIPTRQDMEQILDRSPLQPTSLRDITAEVLPCARMIHRLCFLPRLAIRLHLDWLVYGFDSRMRRNRQGHIHGAKAYTGGLMRGHLRHVWCGGEKRAKPASQ